MKKFVPFDYQMYAINEIIEKPCVGLFLDMGLGKTVITLSALLDLKYNRFSVCRVLIIAPTKVAEDTWQSEAKKWEHLSRLRFSTVLGDATQRIRALNTPADIYVINRENTQWIVDYYKHRWPFDTVVLDESSSFKSYKAKRFKALKTIRPRINRLIELTGTPSPHGVEDLWSQIYLLDGGARLGRTISVFRDLYLDPDKRDRQRIFSYAPKEGALEDIQRRLSDICVSMKAADYLTLPDMLYDDIPVVLDADAQKAYDELESSMVLQVEREAFLASVRSVDGLCAVLFDFDDDIPRITESLAADGYTATENIGQWISTNDPQCVLLTDGTSAIPESVNATVIQYDDVISADNAASLSSKLLQLCSGAVYTKEREVIHVHDNKLDALMEAVEQLNGQHALICYYFNHDRDRLMSCLAKTSLNVRVYADARDKDDWNANNIDLLLIHPASCGYGLNLQEGGHHIIWFTPTWNLEEYQQTNKRLHRTGQRFPVIVHRLIVKNGRDEDVITSLEQKDFVQDNLLQSLKARIQKVKGRETHDT